MRIVFATAELSPIATVGGLASAAAGLSAELRRQGVQVDIVMPDYGGIELADERIIDLDMPEWAGPGRVRVGLHDKVGELHLVDVPGIARSHPYQQPNGEGWRDNADRFFRFSRAVAAFVELDPPDLVHLNDWHTGTALAAIDEAMPSVVSIHNLAYQGTTDGSWLNAIGPRARHYEWWGATNPLTGAFALADAIVAVSPNYAAEILTPEGGCGVHAALAARGPALMGILNGIDTDLWDPATDPLLPARFDVADLSGKQTNRQALLDRFGFADDRVPVATVVTRLTPQKGIDLLLPVLRLLADVPVRVAVLGSGDEALAHELRMAAAAYPDEFGFVEGYDEALSHLMFAGADLFLMPSRFEPCGLTQLQAMRYGTIPVATAVGGLVDTVPDADADVRNGRGFLAAQPTSIDLLAALFRAVRRTGDNRRKTGIQKRGMSVDWSWASPAREYIDLYERLVAGD